MVVTKEQYVREVVSLFRSIDEKTASSINEALQSKSIFTDFHLEHSRTHTLASAGVIYLFYKEKA